MKKLLLTLLGGVLCSLVAMAAEQTASFSLVSFTAGNPVDITSSDNTDVSLSIGRSGTSNVSADSKSRGLRVQVGRFFTVTVPSEKYITKVEFTSGSNGNPNSDGTVGVWSVTGETSNWKLGGKAETYTWTNGGSNLSNPMTFTQTAATGDAYISAVKVYYNDAPKLEDVAPTIKTQPTNATTITDVATTLSVAAEGTPTPGYQWYSCDDADKTNAQKIDGATGNSYNFTTSTAGTYYFYAEAENKVGKATSNVVTVTVNQAYVMTFAKGDADFIGTLPTAIRTNGELKVTTPKCNYSLYLADKTFTHWTDGVNTYLPNTEYTLSSNVTVTPVFANNTVTLDNLVATTTVKFIKSTSVAATYQSANQNAVVEQLTDNGKTIDVALIIKNGKFDLQPANNRAQTNQNTVVSIPVVDGAVVKIGIYDNNSTKAHDCTINGKPVADYLDGTATTTVRNMTYTYHGTATSIDYVVNANNMYANNIDVTYPGKFEPSTTFSMKTAATGNVSVDASADHVAIPDAAKLTINGGSVTVSNGQKEAKSLVTTAGFAMTNGNTFFTVTLDNALQAGDVITATMSAAARGLKFATSDAYSTDYPGEAATTTSFFYTVVAGDGICGETTFNVFRATGNSTYFNNFKITRPATVDTPTIGKNGYSTYCSDYAFTVSGATAYKATCDGETVTLEEISGAIPAGEGVILRGTEGATATLLYAASAPAVANNALKGVNSETTAFAEGDNYVLASNGTQTAFVNMAAGKAVADMMNKAYLNLPAGSAVKSVLFIDEDNTTAVAGVAEAKAEVKAVKLMTKDGLLIKTANGIVNAAGAQVK